MRAPPEKPEHPRVDTGRMTATRREPPRMQNIPIRAEDGRGRLPIRFRQDAARIYFEASREERERPVESFDDFVRGVFGPLKRGT